MGGKSHVAQAGESSTFKNALEIYYSNGGTLDLEKHKVSPDGGLTERYAKEMDMLANLLPEQQLAQAASVETAADTGADDSTSANVRNWMECVRSRKKPNADIEAGYSHSDRILILSEPASSEHAEKLYKEFVAEYR